MGSPLDFCGLFLGSHMQGLTPSRLLGLIAGAAVLGIGWYFLAVMIGLMGFSPLPIFCVESHPLYAYGICCIVAGINIIQRDKRERSKTDSR